MPMEVPLDGTRIASLRMTYNDVRAAREKAEIEKKFSNKYVDGTLPVVTNKMKLSTGNRTNFRRNMTAMIKDHFEIWNMASLWQ
jgi:hypothetical protein